MKDDGAPKIGNLRHGLLAGKLPPKLHFIERRLQGFRRNLEQAVIDVRGEVTVTDAAFIQTCYRHERHALLCQRWLTTELDKLKPMERLHFSREIARASGERDKALAALRLDESKEDLFDRLYSDGKGTELLADKRSARKTTKGTG